jgi:hypothetical protein
MDIDYKGYRITVLARHDDEKWRGNYHLVIIGKTDAKSIRKEYLHDPFDSQQGAFTDAEKAAREWIDRNPIAL